MGLSRQPGHGMSKSYLMSLGFTKSDADPNLYYKVEDGYPLILVLYEDDLFLTGDDGFDGIRSVAETI
jgi:hypothetical protein